MTATDIVPAFGENSILQRASAKLTSTSLVITDPETPYETLSELLHFCEVINDASNWWIGDCLNQMEMRYGDKVYQAAGELKKSEQTIMNIMSICRSIPRSRRRENVKFTTHAEVAALPPDEQTEWLRKAEENRWKKMELRAAVKGQLPPAVVECRCERCGNVHVIPEETEAA